MNYSKFLPGITTILVVISILFLSLKVLEPFLFVIIISFILSVFLNPVFEWFHVKLKRPPLAAVMTLLILLLFIILPLAFVLVSIVNEARGLYEQLSDQPTLFADTQNYIESQIKNYGIPIETIEFNLQEQAAGILKTVIQNTGSVLLYAGSFFLNLFFVLITTYFFLLQKKKINSYFMDIKLLPQKNFIALQKRTIEMVNGVVRGNLIVILVQIIAGSVGFFIFGLPATILFGVLYGLLSLVPAIGGFLVWGPTAIILFFVQGPVVALLFAGWFILTNLLIDNFIAPKIIGSQTRLHQILIMFSVVGGVSQFGLVGIVLGPLIIALAFVAIEMYKELLGDK